MEEEINQLDVMEDSKKKEESCHFIDQIKYF